MSCDHENPTGNRFCGGCGAPLQANKPQRGAPERDPRTYTPKHLADKASLITGLDTQFPCSPKPFDKCNVPAPIFIAVSGSNLFVADQVDGTIAEYTTSAETVNASLITGLPTPVIVSPITGLPSLGLGSVTGIAVSGSNLFVAEWVGTGTIGEYTTSGETVNASLITGLFWDPPVFAVGGGPVACGAGPELALVVPLLRWLGSRRRRVAR